MTEVDLGGIYVSPFAIHLLEAAVVFLALRWVLARTGILDKVWYLALAEMAGFVLILFTVVALN
jgi:protein AaeX